MATKKETTAEQTAESTMPTQEEMQKLLEENARLKAERDAAEAARIDVELAAAQSKETEQLKEDEELTAGQKQVQMENGTVVVDNQFGSWNRSHNSRF